MIYLSSSKRRDKQGEGGDKRRERERGYSCVFEVFCWLSWGVVLETTVLAHVGHGKS